MKPENTKKDQTLQDLIQTRDFVEHLSVDCAIFGFDAPVPCLLIKRRSYGADGDMLEYVEGLFRGDTYTYKLSLRI